MENIRVRRKWHCLIGLLMILVACQDEPVDVVFSVPFENSGVFISCEGNFLAGNASLSFYDREARRVYNRAYFARNRVPLGDVAQSLASDGSNLYIVVNNSGKVVAADFRTLEHRGTLGHLVSPRYLCFTGENKAYVSDLYAREIAIINTATLEKTGFIRVPDGRESGYGHSTECFIGVGPLLFVSCWSYDNQILVIDTRRDALIDSITVPRQPRKMAADKLGGIWLITDGDYQGGTTGFDRPSLVRIDTETRTLDRVFPWIEPGVVPRDLRLNPAGDSLYFIAGDLYRMAITDEMLPSGPFIRARNRLFYSLGVDPRSGELYLADAVDFLQGGIVYRFTPAGSPVDSFRVGVNPGDFLFN